METWGNKEILGTKMKGEKAAKPRWKQSYENGGTGENRRGDIHSRGIKLLRVEQFSFNGARIFCFQMSRMPRG